MAPDFNKYRQDFPMLTKSMHGRPLIYLDSAATAQKPQVVIDTLKNYYQDHYGTVHRAVYELSVYATHEYEGVREKVRALLNAEKVSEIIFTRGTTDSINIVADSFGRAFVKPGDEIIISHMEHHSNIVPWQMMCEQRGAILRVIPIDKNGELQLEEYAKLLNPKVKLVSICHVANSTGVMNPVKKIIEMAHANGSKILIDGAQSVPHMPVDVRELDADFYVFSGHKIYGPNGVGILYGKEKLLDQMPPHHGGGDMVNVVTFPKTTYNVLPLKFEPGTPMVGDVIALGAALDYVTGIGLSAINRYEHELLLHATKLMEEVEGVRLYGNVERKGAILLFTVDGAHALDIGTMLDLRGVAIRTGNHCAQPTMHHFGLSSACRASLAFYNTKQEIDQFIVALKDVIKMLK